VGVIQNEIKKIAAFSITALLTFTLLNLSSSASADVLGETECYPAVLMLKGSGAFSDI
jgi:hypothetical protein